jgi:hypothetical protein
MIIISNKITQKPKCSLRLSLSIQTNFLIFPCAKDFLINFTPAGKISCDVHRRRAKQDCHRQHFSLQNTTKKLLFLYVATEVTGALLASLFVRYASGNYAFSEANSPNYVYPLPLIFGVEILASALVMDVILVVAYTKGLRGFSGLVIGWIVGLDIFFFAFMSGASMNPARSLAPALVSGVLGNLWLYWTATFIGTSLITIIFRKKFR